MKELQQLLIERLKLSQKNIIKEPNHHYVSLNDKIPIDGVGLSMDELLDWINEAIRTSKVQIQYILDELGNYQDPDDLLDAYDRGDLTYYKKWEDEFGNLIFKSSSFDGKEGDIADFIWENAYDIFLELQNYPR